MVGAVRGMSRDEIWSLQRRISKRELQARDREMGGASIHTSIGVNFHPGGMKEISRWSSAATPPDSDSPQWPCIPEGCQRNSTRRTWTRGRLIGRAKLLLSREPRSMSSGQSGSAGASPSRTIPKDAGRPSATPPGWDLSSDHFTRWCRCAQPPANFCDPGRGRNRDGLSPYRTVTNSCVLYSARQSIGSPCCSTSFTAAARSSGVAGLPKASRNARST